MEALIKKRIEEAAKKYNARAYSPFDDPYELSKEFERDCYCFKEGASFALQNQWISVDDGLPDYGEDVFVRYEIMYTETPQEVGYCVRWRTKDETVKTDSNGFSIIGDMEITHWMEIPSLEGGEE